MIIAIIGAGNFGSALAAAAKRAGNRVKIFDTDPKKSKTRTMALAVKDARLIVVAVPSQFAHAAVGSIARTPGRAPVLIASKGFPVFDIFTRSRKFVKSPLGVLGVLGGPAIASQIVQGVPTTVVVGSDKIGRIGPIVTKAFVSPAFCVEWSDDAKGVALGAALKNMYAIGLGILDGLGSASNTKAMFVAAATREMCVLGRTLGAKEQTITGLAGLGDLIGTGFGIESRNRQYGEALARNLKKKLDALRPNAEGLRAAPVALAYAKKKRLALPLLIVINQIVTNRARPRILFDRLAALCVLP